MHEYARRFYDFQTIARGRLTEESLRKEFDAVRPSYQKRLGPFLPDDRDAAILDCPCGYGNILYFLRAEGYANVVGIDLDPKQVELARQLDLPARVDEGIAYLQSRPSSLDLIISVDFLEHLDRNAAVQYLDVALDALRDGGVFLARTPCADGPFGAAHRFNDITHEWGMTSVCATALLQMTGYAEVTILDEHPMILTGRVSEYRRVLAFKLSRFIGRNFFAALTGSAPRIWSRSMWMAGRKGLRDSRSRAHGGPT